MASVWSSLEVAKLIVGVLTPLAVVFLGYWVNMRLKRLDESQHEATELRRQLYEEGKEAERREREERKNELERRYEPHIEFTIGCRFSGPRDELYLASFVLTAHNRGHVIHRFPSIKLRLRGIKKDDAFQVWEEQKPRARFPHKLFEAEVVPPGLNFLFVEPGVSQSIHFTTIIPADYSLLLARAEFFYEKYRPHTAEGLFAVSSQEA